MLSQTGGVLAGALRAPREIVALFSDRKLREIEHYVEVEYTFQQAVASRVADMFKPLRERMDSSIEEEIRVTDPRTWENYSGPPDAQVGDTTFRHYYTGDTDKSHSEDITKWRWDAQRRLLQDLLEALGNLLEQLIEDEQ